MKRLLTALALIVCLMATGCGEGRRKESAKPGDALEAERLPAIEFELKKYTLGDIRTDTIASPRLFIFPFTNTGEGELQILECHTNCKCLTVEKPKGTIKPGEKGEIRAWFDFSGQPGGGFRKSVSVITNAEPPLRALYIEGRALD